MSRRRLKRTEAGGCKSPRDEFSDFGSIVRWYIEHKRPIEKAELASFASEATLDSAVERAGLAQYLDGKRWKRYDHQHRIPKAALRKATDKLRRAPLAEATDFHSLCEMVKKEIDPIPGVGELTVYDTALRIGAKRELLPKRVYLHAGARVGARALGLKNWRAQSLDLHEFPAELQQLEPYEIEDCLCMFADEFAKIMTKR
jgi:hypothetical protein